MKTLIQYIYEELIFEKKTKGAMSIAKLIVKEIKKRDKVPLNNILKKLPEDFQKDFSKETKNDKDILNNTKVVVIPKYHFSKVNKDLDIIYLEHPNLHFNSFDPDKNRLTFTSPSDDVSSIANEIGHEYSHIVDWAKGNNHGNDTYTPGQDEGLFDKFLYLISNTEQKAMKINLKEKLVKNSAIQKFVNSGQLTIENINDFAKDLCAQMINNRHEQLKKHKAKSKLPIISKGKKHSYDVYNEKELPEDVQGTVENPLRLLEYKYYIMDSVKNFKNFIENDEVTGEPRPKEVKQYILSKLSIYTDKGRNIEEIYNKINKVYKQSCNNYLQDLQNAIKIIHKNSENKS